MNKAQKRAEGKLATKPGRNQRSDAAPARAKESDKRWRKAFGRELFSRLQKAARRDGMTAEEELAHALTRASRDQLTSMVIEYGKSTKTLAALAANWLQPSREARRMALVEAGYRLEADGWQTPEAAGIPNPEEGTFIPKTNIMYHSEAHGFYLYERRRPCRLNGKACDAHDTRWAIYDALKDESGQGRLRFDLVYEPERRMVKRLTRQEAAERVARWTANEIPEMFRGDVCFSVRPPKMAA